MIVVHNRKRRATTILNLDKLISFVDKEVESRDDNIPLIVLEQGVEAIGLLCAPADALVMNDQGAVVKPSDTGGQLLYYCGGKSSNARQMLVHSS